MYRIFVRFNYEDIIKGYYNTLEEAKAAYEQWKHKYDRMGYTGKVGDVVYEEPIETKTDEEWVYTVTRIPFCGSSVDPGTGFRDEYPTGMTDTIEIHLELGNKSYAINDWKISCPENRAKMWAMGKIVPVTPGPTPTGKYLVSASAVNGTVAGGGYYDEGATCTLTVTPDTGYNFASWDDGSTENPRSFTVTGNVTLVATCTSVPVYTLTFLATNGTCEPTSFTGTVGSIVSVTVIPNEGLVFHHWDDGSQMNPRTFTVGPESKTYTATCQTPTMRTITMTSIANCSVTVNDVPYTGPIQVAESTMCTINCIPAEGYKFTKWQGDVIALYTPYEFRVAAKNYTISPVVDHITYTLSFEDNAYLTFTGAGTYNAGTSVQIEAIPNAHARFVEWWDGSDENPRTVVVNSNMRLSAVGHAITYNLVVNAAPINGLPSGNVTGGGSYVYGSMAPLTFTPIDGKTNFDSWSDGGTISHSHRVTTDEEVTAYATGIVQPHYETATHGSITIHPSSSWVYGDNAVVEFVPEQHYHFVSWQGGDTNNPRTILVDGPITASCIGVLDQHMVTTQTEHFTITATVAGVPHVLDPTGISVPYGTEVTFSYVAEDHYHFSHWSTGAETEVITLVIEGDTEINIEYTTDPQYEVKLNSAHGTVSGGGWYWEHDDVQIKVLSIDDEYQFKKWTQHGTAANWTITDITEDYEDTVEYEDWHGLTITCTGGDVSLMWSHSYGSLLNRPTIYWSSNRITWTSWKLTGTSGNHIHDMEDGDVLYFKGDGVYSHGYHSSSRSFRDFTFSTYGTNIGYLHITGRITSLIDMHGREDTTMSGSGYFSHFFRNCGRLQSVDDELFPYTTGAASETFWGTFENCTSLIKAPRLRFTNLAYLSCLEDMFSGCTSLNEIRIDAEVINGGYSNFTKDVPASGGVFRGPESCRPGTGTAAHPWNRNHDTIYSGVPENWEYVAIDEE